MSQTLPIDCHTKDNFSLLDILLQLISVNDDGELYLNIECNCPDSGSSAVSLNASLVEGDNPFILTKTPTMVQIWAVSLVGEYTQLFLSTSFIGPLLNINSGNIYTNVVITYI